MTTVIHVIKRDGSREPFMLEKWQAQIAKVCEGVADVSPSMIEISASPHFYDGMTTRELDNIALRAMVELIDEETNPYGNVNYQYVAGKQRISMLRKDVYGSYAPPHLLDIVKKNVELGLYTEELLTWYSEEEWEFLNKHIDHAKDELMTFAAVEQLVDKYLVRNRATGVIVETPQVRYMIAAATAFHAETKNRLKWVVDFYNAAADGLFTLATPVLAGLGTKTKQFSSCVLLRSDDTLKSIFATGQVMADYAARRAGIGLEMGRLRPLGAPIRNGEIMHTGILPFIKKWYADLRSCCLRPDMLVEVMADEEKARRKKTIKTRLVKIADVKPLMKIKTATADGTITFKPVTAVFDTIVPFNEQVKVEFDNGTVVHCSINHPFMVRDDGGLKQRYPQDLTAEDKVVTENGFTRVSAVEIYQHNDQRYVDITVEDTHVFFTKAAPEQEAVLTHNSQGGIRNSSATINIPIWHYQFDDYIVLKNNKGTEETRVRQLDYCVVLNKFFWRRFLERGNITFFDPNEVPDLYEAFYRNSAEFERLYVELEKRKDVTKKVESAETVFKEWILTERLETGRIYILNIDNVSSEGPFDTTVHPIYQTNLCVSPDTIINAVIDGQQLSIRVDKLTARFNDGAEISVLSKDINTGEIRYARVTAAAKTGTGRKLLKITDSVTGKSVKVTPNHQVYTKNRGWVIAAELKPDDQLDVV